MNNCRFEKQAYLYAAGDLSPQEKQAFEAHMEQCEACRAIVSETAAARNALSAQAPQPLAGLDQRILSKVYDRVQQEKPDAWAFLWRWNRVLAPAAAAVCLLLLLSVVFTSPNKAVQSGQTETAQVEAEAPSEVFVQAQLDETAQKYLASDSDDALSYYLEDLMSSSN